MDLVSGCTKISAGCIDCYAEITACRLCAMRLEESSSILF
jgi:protein gp37